MFRPQATTTTRFVADAKKDAQLFDEPTPVSAAQETPSQLPQFDEIENTAFLMLANDIKANITSARKENRPGVEFHVDGMSNNLYLCSKPQRVILRAMLALRESGYCITVNEPRNSIIIEWGTMQDVERCRRILDAVKRHSEDARDKVAEKRLSSRKEGATVAVATLPKPESKLGMVVATTEKPSGSVGHGHVAQSHSPKKPAELPMASSSPSSDSDSESTAPRRSRPHRRHREQRHIERHLPSPQSPLTLPPPPPPSTSPSRQRRHLSPNRHMPTSPLSSPKITSHRTLEVCQTSVEVAAASSAGMAALLQTLDVGAEGGQIASRTAFRPVQRSPTSTWGASQASPRFTAPIALEQSNGTEAARTHKPRDILVPSLPPVPTADTSENVLQKIVDKCIANVRS